MFPSQDWDTFHSLCTDQLTTEYLIALDPIKSFLDQLVHITTNTIPKTLTMHRIIKPGFNDVYKQARKQRRQAEHQYTKHPTQLNLHKLRIS